MDMFGTFWSLVPPIVAITLALITKEVYSSLFIGVLVGGIFFGGFNFEKVLLHITEDGFLKVLSDPWNVGILIFLALLGMVVVMMNNAGGSAAFGRWAKTRIKSRTGAQIATIVLGMLIFIDDYFNCLAVGSVMRPVTDAHNVSRSKLAYLIDATAAPICIIAPISSWAAAVTGFVEDENGFMLFIKSIPYNFYALFTIAMMFAIVIMKIDFGPMRVHERNAIKGDIYTTEDRPYKDLQNQEVNPKGRMIDLVLPVVVLIVACIIGMLYTGGFFSLDEEGQRVGIAAAFANSDASVGLLLGSICGLIAAVIFYLCRRVMSLKSCMECVPNGLKAMVPAILILTLAWTLKEMTSSLGAAEYVSGLMENSAEALHSFLPAIIFIVACFLAFATGTSWGTFGILIPIVVTVFAETDSTLLVIGMSACLAGAVCGDHCSPISDTTIMASAGAQCNHVNHVSTQLPYAMLVAAVSFVTFLIAGFVRNAPICLLIGAALLLGVLFIIKKKEPHPIGIDSSVS